MKYEVWCPDIGSGPEDARTFDAHSNYAAAEAWAFWEDAHSADYWIVNGQEARVCVRACGSATAHEFVVRGEMAREYRARPATANAGGNATERSEGRVDHNVGRLTPGED